MGDLLWRRSPWDGLVHAFRVLGEVVSEAICRHSARTSALEEPVKGAMCCQGCLVAYGHELAKTRHEEDPQWPT